MWATGSESCVWREWTDNGEEREEDEEESELSAWDGEPDVDRSESELSDWSFDEPALLDSSMIDASDAVISGVHARWVPQSFCTRQRVSVQPMRLLISRC